MTEPSVFKRIASDLAEAVIAMQNHPDPVVRMSAAKINLGINTLFAAGADIKEASLRLEEIVTKAVSTLEQLTKKEKEEE